MPRILVVEDEDHLATGIRFNLELEGYEVDVIDDGGEALRRLTPPSPPAGAGNGWDLVLLDVMLPGLDGFQVVDRMRAAGNFTPVLMLTAKSLPEDLVQGLEAGADDYLPKPFDLTVLLARVKGLLRRRDWARGSLEGVPGEGGAGVGPTTARVGEALIDFRNFEVKTRGQTVRLTLLEAMLLKLLVQNAGQVGGLQGRDPGEGLEREPRHRDSRRGQLHRAPAPGAGAEPTLPEVPAHGARRGLQAARRELKPAGRIATRHRLRHYPPVGGSPESLHAAMRACSSSGFTPWKFVNRTPTV